MPWTKYWRRLLLCGGTSDTPGLRARNGRAQCTPCALRLQPTDARETGILSGPGVNGADSTRAATTRLRVTITCRMTRHDEKLSCPIKSAAIRSDGQTLFQGARHQ
jgi:hypothetical protein